MYSFPGYVAMEYMTRCGRVGSRAWKVPASCRAAASSPHALAAASSAIVAAAAAAAPADLAVVVVDSARWLLWRWLWVE